MPSTGTINGVGLDSGSNPEAWGTASLVDVTSGETVGFQFIQPTGAAPVPYSIPYDPATVNPNADYVVVGAIWDGTTQWLSTAGVPVLTKDNARSDVQVTVAAVPTPTSTPSVTPAPTATAAPVAPAESGGGPGSILLVLLVIAGVIGVGAYVIRSRRTAA